MKNYSFTTANVSLLRNSFYNFYLFGFVFSLEKMELIFFFFFVIPALNQQVLI